MADDDGLMVTGLSVLMLGEGTVGPQIANVGSGTVSAGVVP